MSRINAVVPETSTGHAKELLDAVKAKFGVVPNLMRGLANSPAALDAYLQFSGKLSNGLLPAKTREQIALAVGQQNHCDYCVAAHSTIGKMVGLTADQILDGRRGGATDPKTAALLKFSRKVVEVRGLVSDADVEEVRRAGATDGEIAEVVANVALNIFTNYFNHVAETVIDFPAAAPLPE
jgi:uncharacterized peroxidase-related enzyme